MLSVSISRAGSRAGCKLGRLVVAGGLATAWLWSANAPSRAAAMARTAAMARPAAPGAALNGILPIQAPAATTGPNVEANLAQLHQRLQITPAQQPKFDTFANVMRQNSRMRPAAAPASPTAVDELRLAIQDSDLELTALKRLLPAMQALYSSLSPT